MKAIRCLQLPTTLNARVMLTSGRGEYKTSLRLQTIANKLRNIQHSVVEWNLVAVITLGEEQTTEQKLKAQLHNY